MIYEFKSEKDFKSFDDFLIKNGGTYMQCSLWPDAKPAWKPHFYVGFKGNDSRKKLTVGRSGVVYSGWLYL